MCDNSLLIKMAISFVNLPKTVFKGKKNTVKWWVQKTAQIHKCQIEQLVFNFCSDNELLKINREFLKHNTFTDIITFDYSEKEKISGDIYISTERVIENAEKFSSLVTFELLRVMIHGVLHLCGYKDKTLTQKRQMRKMEDRALLNYSRLTKRKIK